MSIRYLLDTNILSEPVKAVPNMRVMERLQRHRGHLATAAPVLHELRFGVLRLAKGRKREILQAYIEEIVLPTVPVLAYDARAAEWHAAERARLERKGSRALFVDGQIAAIARVNDLTLVTANSTDFSRYRGLKVADWRPAGA